MFTTLFQRPTVISRYRAGPLAEERERFLMQCEARGYSRSMLQKIAWILLAVAHCIPIDHGKVNRRDIEQAVEGRTRFKRRPDGARTPRALAGCLSTSQLSGHVASAALSLLPKWKVRSRCRSLPSSGICKTSGDCRRSPFRLAVSDWCGFSRACIQIGIRYAPSRLPMWTPSSRRRATRAGSARHFLT